MRSLAIMLLLTFALATPAVAYDVNGDGLADAVTNDSLDSVDSTGSTVVFGAGDRSAPVSPTVPGDRGFRITDSDFTRLDGNSQIVGDVNGDGKADVLVAGNVVFGKAGTEPVDLATDRGAYIELDVDPIFMTGVGDVNGDGLADVFHVRETRGSLARVRLGSRQRPLHRHIDVYAGRGIPRGPRPDLHAVGDVNGDGLDDVAIGLPDPDGRASGFEFDEMLAVVFGKRDRKRVTISRPRAHAPIAVRSGGRPAGYAVRIRSRRFCPCPLSDAAAIGDVNGDGLGDLAILLETNDLYVAFGRRRTSTVRLPGRAGAVVNSVPSYRPFVAAGDLDGDKRDDLLVGASRPAGLALLSGRRIGRGASLRAGAARYVTGAVDRAVPLGDFDGDGRSDLLVARGRLSGPVGSVDPHWVIFGSSPLLPVDLRQPAPNLRQLG